MAGPRGRRLLVAAALVALLAVGGAVFVLYPREELLVAFDAAFAATRPSLVAAIKAPRFGPRRLVYLELPLEAGPSRLVQVLEARKRPPKAIAVSPLLAQALIQGAARNGAKPPGPLLAIELRGEAGSPAPPGLAARLASDPLPAWRLAGRLFGALASDWRKGLVGTGGVPAPAAEAALLFEEGPGRPAGLVAAFKEGWASVTDLPPRVEELSAGAGATEAADRIRNLLSGDLRALLVGAGPAALGALGAAFGEGRLVALATSNPATASGAWPLAALALHPDEGELLSLLLAWDPDQGGTLPSPPWVLGLLPGATTLAEGEIELERRLGAAEKLP